MLHNPIIKQRLREDQNLAAMRVYIAECRKALDALERSWERHGVDMDERHAEYSRFCNAAHRVTEIDALYIAPNEDTVDGRYQMMEADEIKANAEAARSDVLAAYHAKHPSLEAA